MGGLVLVGVGSQSRPVRPLRLGLVDGTRSTRTGGVHVALTPCADDSRAVGVAGIGPWHGVRDSQPLAGGHSGETFLAEAAGERTVVRIYGERSAARGPEAPRGRRRRAALVRGLLPVPEVLEVRRADPQAGHARRCWSRRSCRATRLDLLLPSSTTAARADGRAAASGSLVAGSARCRCRGRALFVDGDLRIEPLPGRRPAGLRRVAPRRAPPSRPWTDATSRRPARRSRTAPRSCSTRWRRTLPGAQRPEPQEPAGRPGDPRGHRASWTGSSRTPAARSPTWATCCASTATRRSPTPCWRPTRERVVDAAGRRSGPGPGRRPVRAGRPGRPARRRTRWPSGRTTCCRAIAPSGDLHAVLRRRERRAGWTRACAPLRILAVRRSLPESQT